MHVPQLSDRRGGVDVVVGDGVPRAERGPDAVPQIAAPPVEVGKATIGVGTFNRLVERETGPGIVPLDEFPMQLLGERQLLGIEVGMSADRRGDTAGKRTLVAVAPDQETA